MICWSASIKTLDFIPHSIIFWIVFFFYAAFQKWMHLLPNNSKAFLLQSWNNSLQLSSSMVPDLTVVDPLILQVSLFPRNDFFFFFQRHFIISLIHFIFSLIIITSIHFTSISGVLGVAGCGSVLSSPPKNLTCISHNPDQAITTSGDYNRCVWSWWLHLAQSGFRGDRWQ